MFHSICIAVSGSKADNCPQWTQMSGWILHEKYGISTGQQRERFSLQNTSLVIWESGFRSSLGTSCKIVAHTYWKSFSTLFNDKRFYGGFRHSEQLISFPMFKAACAVGVNGMSWLRFKGSSSRVGINFSVVLLPCT